MDCIKAFFKDDRFAAHNGIELVEVSSGRSRVRMTLRPSQSKGLNLAHGGALFQGLAYRKPDPLPV